MTQRRALSSIYPIGNLTSKVMLITSLSFSSSFFRPYYHTLIYLISNLISFCLDLCFILEPKTSFRSRYFCAILIEISHLLIRILNPPHLRLIHHPRNLPHHCRHRLRHYLHHHLNNTNLPESLQ